jgi:excisionase family DNA binding protein
LTVSLAPLLKKLLSSRTEGGLEATALHDRDLRDRALSLLVGDIPKVSSTTPLTISNINWQEEFTLSLTLATECFNSKRIQRTPAGTRQVLRKNSIFAVEVKQPLLEGLEMIEKVELLSGGALTVSQAVKEFAIGRTVIYELMGRGELAYSQVGRRRLIPRRALMEYLARALVGGIHEVKK